MRTSIFLLCLGLLSTSCRNFSPIEAIKNSPIAGPAASSTPVPTPIEDGLPPYTASSGVTSYRAAGSITGTTYGFIEYLPQNYASIPAGSLPLVIFLHGIGEQGNGSVTSLNTYRNNTGASAGVQYAIDRGRYYNAVVLTPQSPGWWNASTLNTFLTYALSAYKVNPKRVLVTGLSMGGGGTWDFVSAYPAKIAAAMPICGASACSASTANLVSQNVKVWSFHARNDGTVTISNSYSCMNRMGTALGQVATIESGYDNTTPLDVTAHFNNSTKRWVFEAEVDCQDAAGNPWPVPICQTIYPSGGHGIWSRVYSHPTDLPMLWLLKQKRP